MQILRFSHPREIARLMRDIQVDPYGIRIMLPKALHYLVRINSLSNIAANILKQEMLSLGAEAAVARGALTGQVKRTDCLLMGNLAQLRDLSVKLRRQPFGLSRVAVDLSLALRNYSCDEFLLDLSGRKVKLGKRSQIMGIINLTPDSFSGDGLWPGARVQGTGYRDKAVELAEEMARDGADMIDVGGESSRPGAKPVSLKEELARVVPVIKALKKKIRVPLSVDTVKPAVASAAVLEGADIVNDIGGLRDKNMRKVVSRQKAAVVVMHMKGNPRTMQKNPVYSDLIFEINEYLSAAIKRAFDSGIAAEKIIVDPGIGFGKAAEDNLEILNRLREFKILGRPVMAGASRKSFIGKILKLPPQERLFGTISACVLAAANGADILRVHDVKAVRQALAVADAVNK